MKDTGRTFHRIKFLAVLAGILVFFLDPASAKMTECEPGSGCIPTPVENRAEPPGAVNSPGEPTCSVPECTSCQRCERHAEETQEKCTNIGPQLTKCNEQMAAALDIAQGEVSESQLGILQAALGPSAACLTEVDQRITMCKSVVSQCESSCDSAEGMLQTIMGTSGPATTRYKNALCKLDNVISEKMETCRSGSATVAQLEAAKQQLAQQNAQLLQAIAFLGPAAIDFVMNALGSGADDYCATLKKDLGEDHPTTQGYCGDRYEPPPVGDNDEDPDDTQFDAPGGGGGDQTMGLNLNSQTFDGVGNDRSRSSSKVKEQSVQASSSGGGPALGSSGSSAKSPTTTYKGGEGARGFNTNIMSDPEGTAGGRRGTASQPGRAQSQWLVGQQASARAKAEAARRAAEAAAQRKRELRGPHAQGLFESVSETYRRYQHEMMQ